MNATITNDVGDDDDDTTSVVSTTKDIRGNTAGTTSSNTTQQIKVNTTSTTTSDTMDIPTEDDNVVLTKDGEGIGTTADDKDSDSSANNLTATAVNATAIAAMPTAQPPPPPPATTVTTSVSRDEDVIATTLMDEIDFNQIYDEYDKTRPLSSPSSSSVKSVEQEYDTTSSIIDEAGNKTVAVSKTTYDATDDVAKSTNATYAEDDMAVSTPVLETSSDLQLDGNDTLVVDDIGIGQPDETTASAIDDASGTQSAIDTKAETMSSASRIYEGDVDLTASFTAMLKTMTTATDEDIKKLNLVGGTPSPTFSTEASVAASVPPPLSPPPPPPPQPLQPPPLEPVPTQEHLPSTPLSVSQLSKSPVFTIHEPQDLLDFLTPQPQINGDPAIDTICVVKVWARWCQSCKAVQPKYKQLAMKMKKETASDPTVDVRFAELEFVRGNVKEELAEGLQATKFPHILIYKNMIKESSFVCLPKDFKELLVEHPLLSSLSTTQSRPTSAVGVTSSYQDSLSRN